MQWDKYNYLAIDTQFGQKIPFYNEHLENARANGHNSLYDWVTSLYKELQSQTAVGKIIGVHQKTISNWLRRAGLPTRPKGGANNVRN
jgi:hypothetical protein